MNTRQQIAWASPCYEAEATTQRRFGSTGRAGVWYVIIGLATAGALTALALVEIAESVWAGRRRYPRIRR